MAFIDDELFRYWGKFEGDRWHPLVYHCLDVASVALRWLKLSSAVRRSLHCEDERDKCPVAYFIFLHDLGKADLRFQLKGRSVMERLWPSKDLSELDSVLHRGYMHGPAGLILFEKDRKAVYSDSVTDWMRSVAAHHGSMSPVDLSVKTERFGPDLWKERDERVRFQMTSLGRDLFLKDFPEENIGEPPYGLLGFCSVCDWLASNEEWFPYRSESVSPEDYMDERFSLAETALRECGLIGYRSGRCGMDGLFPGWTPRGIQTLSLEDLDDGFPSLAVMEAPTGSGKTEAALALASRWVADGRADSVIFALPTQATANAMFDRLTRIAPVLFPGSANVVLAHGKSRFNSGFRSIMERGAGLPLGEDGLVQCSRWLASGKKRAFLGQIGVCTVDQVLLSVLPVRHGFVRSFGISRSVLIVDEVHAYDSYMNGLLEQVLQFQRDSGGCAILLSATLQHSRLLRLTSLWSGQDASLLSSSSYPLVTLARPGSIDCRIPFRLSSQTNRVDRDDSFRLRHSRR